MWLHAFIKGDLAGNLGDHPRPIWLCLHEYEFSGKFNGTVCKFFLDKLRITSGQLPIKV